MHSLKEATHVYFHPNQFAAAQSANIDCWWPKGARGSAFIPPGRPVPLSQSARKQTILINPSTKDIGLALLDRPRECNTVLNYIQKLHTCQRLSNSLGDVQSYMVHTKTVGPKDKLFRDNMGNELPGQTLSREHGPMIALACGEHPMKINTLTSYKNNFPQLL